MSHILSQRYQNVEESSATAIPIPIFRLGAIHLWRPQKNNVFDPLSPLSTCVHMGRTPLPPLWTSTHGRHEIHTALLKWLVQWPTGPKAEIRLYDSNLFKLYFTDAWAIPPPQFFWGPSPLSLNPWNWVIYGRRCLRQRSNLEEAQVFWVSLGITVMLHATTL